MQTLPWWKQRTDRYGPANYSVSCSAVQDRQYIFAHIRSYMSPGTMVTPKQSSYEKETMGEQKLKM